ncbi:MAG: VOC family protein [Anaerolineaceae bacterium]|nr:VOC family protein [Anaerolineaceae bacterium]
MLTDLFDNLMDVSYEVSDWQRSKKFYGETLGLPVAAFISDEVGWMEFGSKEGTHLAISLWREPGRMTPREGGGIAIFEVADAYSVIKELRRRGVKCDDVQSVPNMVTFASFYDPDGNRLQVAGPPPKE